MHAYALITERRFEQRYPALRQHVATFTQGYDRYPESAAALLAFLDEHFPIDAKMKRKLTALQESHDQD